MTPQHWNRSKTGATALCMLSATALFSALSVTRGEDTKSATARNVVTDEITIPNTVVKFDMVQLPAGQVTIRDAAGKDVVVSIKPIWIGKTEVTWDEYDIFWQALDLPPDERAGVKSDKGIVRARPSAPFEPPDRGWGHDGSPAGSMFCWEAKRYCEWLSKRTNKKYRLPTEAEWEYACRAGGAPLKLDNARLKEVAWYEENSDDQTHPVAKKKPNAWGLYDMLGNVAEWVTTLDQKEAVAGGSFQDSTEDVHSGARAEFSPAWQRKDPQIPKGKSWLSNGGHVGFRVVRED